MAECHKNRGRMGQELWPGVTALLAGCHRIGGRMGQDYWPDVAGILNHHKASFTLDVYCGVTVKMKQEARDTIGALLASCMDE